LFLTSPVAFFLVAPLIFELAAGGQNPAQSKNTQGHSAPAQSQGRGAGGDIGSGTGDIGKGAGKGAGQAGEGVGKGAGDLVTLRPLGAAGDVGKGAGEAGKDVGGGTAKGSGKITKGTGKLMAKPFHHAKKNDGAGTG
jgi:hypothetical protein